MSQILPSTSVLQGIRKHSVDTEITWVVREEKLVYFSKYIKAIDKTLTFPEFNQLGKHYDLFINLFPYYPAFVKGNFTANEKWGLECNSRWDEFRNVLLGEEVCDITLFQLYYLLAGLTWKGEGYDLGYYPRTRSKRNKIGVSVANANLRNYVLEHLHVEGKVWYVPYKKNIFKRMDEINRCSKIITDDMLTFHLAVALRKYVYFLQTYPINYKLEFFSKGQIHKVPTGVL